MGRLGAHTPAGPPSKVQVVAPKAVEHYVHFRRCQKARCHGTHNRCHCSAAHLTGRCFRRRKIRVSHSACFWEEMPVSEEARGKKLKAGGDGLPPLSSSLPSLTLSPLFPPFLPLSLLFCFLQRAGRKKKKLKKKKNFLRRGPGVYVGNKNLRPLLQIPSWRAS